MRKHPHTLRFHSKTTNEIVNLFLSKQSGLEKTLTIIKEFKITHQFDRTRVGSKHKFKETKEEQSPLAEQKHAVLN